LDPQGERNRDSDERRGEAWECLEAAHELGSPVKERDLKGEPFNLSLKTGVKLGSEPWGEIAAVLVKTSTGDELTCGVSDAFTRSQMKLSLSALQI
jgi:hypothetical protein